MQEVLTVFGLWFGAVGVYVLLYIAYRSIYHARRSLKIARTMQQ